MKISIVTASWNSGKTIADTFESVKKQTYKDVEHVVADGGSKDNTLEVIKSFVPQYDECSKTLVWKSERDNGIYDAMNKGITMASGDIIGMLNSDDFLTDTCVIERVAKTFEEHPDVDAIYGDIHFVKDEDLKKCTRYFSSRYFRPWMLRFGFMPAHPSFYCRREVYEKYGLYDLDYRTSSDFEMMVRLFKKYQIKTKYLNLDFVTMRAGGESTAGLASKRKVNQDIAGSLKKHGIYSNQFFQSLRYVWRIGELVYTKIKF